MRNKRLFLAIASIILLEGSCTHAITSNEKIRMVQLDSLGHTRLFKPPPCEMVNSDLYEWNISTPEEYGTDSEQLARAFLEATNFANLYSILLIRNGTLIAERYFNGASKDDAFHIHSVAKSFTTTLVGIAFQEGYLTSLDQKLMDFFPEYASPDLDPRKYNITIHHLLSMTAGFDFPENTANWTAYTGSSNWVKYAIELPLRHSPGADWAYSTPHTNLLSAILTKATGMNTRAFAEKYLFSPLQIAVNHWHQDPQGIYTGGHEMYFAPRNLARLGLLYLENGKIDGQLILSAEWLEKSLGDFTNGSLKEYEEATGGWISISDMAYGYGWWLGTMNHIMALNQTTPLYEVYYAMGLGGNFILNIPELNVIIVTTASGTIFDRSNEEEDIMNFIARKIIPAISIEITPPNTTVSSQFDKNSAAITTGGLPGFELLLLVIGLCLVFISQRKRGK
ncbi:MAG: serine hydrolase domain-containing protein [Candidatus Thorarchaeota archaeon]